MNLEFLKSKSSKIMLGVLGALIVIIIILVMISGGSKNKDKLLLTCSQDRQVQNYLNLNQTITISKMDDGIKMLQNLKLSASDELSNYSQSIYDATIKRFEQEYDYYNSLSYISYNTDYNSDYVLFSIEYNITDESNNQVIDQLNYDFLNNSVNDIKNYFEEGGFKCQES